MSDTRGAQKNARKNERANSAGQEEAWRMKREPAERAKIRSGHEQSAGRTSRVIVAHPAQSSVAMCCSVLQCVAVCCSVL